MEQQGKSQFCSGSGLFTVNVHGRKRASGFTGECIACGKRVDTDMATRAVRHRPATVVPEKETVHVST